MWLVARALDVLDCLRALLYKEPGVWAKGLREAGQVMQRLAQDCSSFEEAKQSCDGLGFF